MDKIILDTNFLLIPAVLKVDIFSEIERIEESKYKLYIIDKTVDELKKIIEKQRGKHSSAAKMALQLISKKKISKIKTDSEKDVDSIIVDLAKKEKIIVATQDKILKFRLKNKAQLITLKAKKYLSFL